MINRKLQSLIAVASAATLSVGLAACGSSGPSESSASTGAATMWTLTGGSEDIFKSSVESWNAEHEDSQIDLTLFANDAYKTKVRTAVGAGEGPTFIYGWGGGVLESYVDSGHVKDLTGFLEENPEVKERFIPSVLKNGVIDGKTYALPNTNMQPVVLYYNKEVFEKIDAEPPRTWEELMALIPQFKSAGIAPIALGGQSKWPSLMWLEYLVDRIGGEEVFKNIAAGEPEAWSDPAVIEALTKIQELVKAGGFIEGFSSITADSGADRALLQTGKSAMLLQGGWVYQNFKTGAADFVSSGDLGYITFPTVEGGSGDPDNIVGNPSNFWSISKTASKEKQETAQAYLEERLFNEEYTQAMIDSGAVPPVQGVEDKLAASDDKDFLTFIYDLAMEAPSFQLSWDQALSPGQANAMLTNLEQIFLLEITPEQFAKNMNATLEK